MPHPIYGPAEHKLQRVQFTLRVPTKENHFMAGVRAEGLTDTKRSNLWNFSENYMVDLADDVHGPADQMLTLALVALQDKPASLAALELALRGGRAAEATTPLF